MKTYNKIMLAIFTELRYWTGELYEWFGNKEERFRRKVKRDKK